MASDELCIASKAEADHPLANILHFLLAFCPVGLKSVATGFFGERICLTGRLFCSLLLDERFQSKNRTEM